MTKITDLVMFNPACLTSFQVDKYLGLFQLGNTYWILPDRSSPVSLSLHLSPQTDILMLSTGHAETRVVLFLKKNTACLSTSRWRRQRRVVAFILMSEWRITTRCVEVRGMGSKVTPANNLAVWTDNSPTWIYLIETDKDGLKKVKTTFSLRCS